MVCRSVIKKTQIRISTNKTNLQLIMTGNIFNAKEIPGIYSKFIYSFFTVFFNIFTIFSDFLHYFLQFFQIFLMFFFKLFIILWLMFW